ncbi:MAG: TMEM43 family protein, partial [bacterium]|nr:TMEM43 family protein [bacterium]
TEEKKNAGGSVTTTKTYTYSKVWSGQAIDSSEFKESGHDNPGALEFPSRTQRAANVSFGAFRLNEGQVSRIGAAKEYAYPADFTCRVARVQLKGTTIYVPNRETRLNEKNERDVASQPRIGDMRVVFRVVYPHEISVVSKQHGDTFVPYVAKTGKRVDLLKDGVADAAEMFADARDANTLFTWGLRLGGFLMMFAGLSMLLKPLSVLADVLPFLGNVVEMGIAVVAGLVSLVCALVTIGVAWLFYRPVLGVALLAVAGLGVWKLVQVRKAAKEKAAAAGAPAAAKGAAAIALAFLSLAAFAEKRVTRSGVTLKGADAAEVAAAAEEFKALGGSASVSLTLEKCDAGALAAAAQAWPGASSVSISDKAADRKLADLAPVAAFTAARRVSIDGVKADFAPLAKLAAVRTLALKYCEIADLAPVAALPALAELDLYASKVKDFSPLAAAKGLRKIGFYAVNPLVPGEDCYRSLGTLKQVTAFHGGLTKMTSLAWLKEVPQAEEVKIFAEKIDDFTPLASLPNLRYLRAWNMDGRNVATAFGSLKVLANATKLERLELPGSVVADFDALAALTALKTLDLAVKCDVDLAFAKGLRNLKKLTLPNDRKTAHKVSNFDALAGLPALEVVSMPNVSGVASLAPLLSCPRLKTVTCAKKAFPEEE